MSVIGVVMQPFANKSVITPMICFGSEGAFRPLPPAFPGGRPLFFFAGEARRSYIDDGVNTSDPSCRLTSM